MVPVGEHITGGSGIWASEEKHPVLGQFRTDLAHGKRGFLEQGMLN